MNDAEYQHIKNSNLWTKMDDLPGEVWRDIIGFEGTYQVSNLGRVKSLNRKNNITRKGRIKRQTLLHGYRRVGFWDISKHRAISYATHRLVGAAFIPNPDNLPCINHKNNIHDDNRVENLEWCTKKENAIHAWSNGHMENARRSGEKHGNSKLKEYQIQEIRERFKTGGFTKTQLAREYGVTDTLIRLIVQKKAWKHIKTAPE